jgi:hypothetical protein
MGRSFVLCHSTLQLRYAQPSPSCRDVGGRFHSLILWLFDKTRLLPTLPAVDDRTKQIAEHIRLAHNVNNSQHNSKRNHRHAPQAPPLRDYDPVDR